MKKLLAVILAMLLLVLPIANADEGLKRGKSWDFTGNEWLDKFNAAVMLDNNLTRVDALILGGEEDYRKAYVAVINDYISLGVMCEDTTEKVYAVVLILDFSQAPDDYNVGTKIGAQIAGYIQCAIFACDDELSAADVQNVYNSLDPSYIATTADSSKTIINNHNKLVLSHTGAQITFAEAREDVYDSEEEFLAYRESTLTGIPAGNTEPAADRAEIMFRGIPWGTSFTEVSNELFPEVGFKGIHGDSFKTYSVDDVILKDYAGIDFEEGGINLIANSKYGEMQVAGYTTKDVKAYFAFNVVDGVLSEAEDDTSLYAAQYVFEPKDPTGMESDLIEKLTSTYGEPSKTSSDKSWNGASIHYTFWDGANDTMVVLKVITQPKGSSYAHETYISYAWRMGDTLLQAANDAKVSEKLNSETAVQGNGDTSGL